MNNKRLMPFVAVLLAGSISVVSANDRLIVVEDLGGTSALPYYEPLNPDPTASALKSLPPIPQRVDETSMLPVTSENLSPGKIAARTLNAGGLVQPVCLVGADPLSLAWLEARGEILKEIRAVCLAVDVPDDNALAAIRDAAPEGVKIVPASGDDLAGRLGIDHYPVLITSVGLEQ